MQKPADWAMEGFFGDNKGKCGDSCLVITDTGMLGIILKGNKERKVLTARTVMPFKERVDSNVPIETQLLSFLV